MDLKLKIEVTGEVIFPKTIIVGEEAFEITNTISEHETTKLGTVMQILKEIGSVNIVKFKLEGDNGATTV